MVIVNQTPQSYFLILDDFFVGEEYPYLSVRNNKPAHDRATYEVKLDRQLLTQQPCKGYSEELSETDPSIHTIEVTAIYHSRRSETKSLTFEVTAETDISDISIQNSKELAHRGKGGQLYFDHAVEQWPLYDLQGRIAKSGKEPQLRTSDLLPGIYLLRLTTSGHYSFTQKLLIP